jgi:hypothetical protein
MRIDTGDYMAVRAENARIQATPAGLIGDGTHTQFSDGYDEGWEMDGSWDPRLVDGELRTLWYCQNELVLLTYLHNLASYAAGHFPDDFVTLLAMLASARLAFPGSELLQADDTDYRLFTALPNDHHLRQPWGLELDGSVATYDCSLCDESFDNPCEAYEHMFSVLHCQMFKRQQPNCPTCGLPIGPSVEDHVFSPDHLEARLVIFYGPQVTILPYVG